MAKEKHQFIWEGWLDFLSYIHTCKIKINDPNRTQDLAPAKLRRQIVSRFIHLIVPINFYG